MTLKPTLYDAVEARVGRLTRAHARRAAGEVVHTHVPTGLPAFDEKFGGTEIGVNTLVVAHTGEGKTSVLAQLAEGAARAGLGAKLYVLEDPEDRVCDRVLSVITGVSANAISRLNADPAALAVALPQLDWARRISLVTDLHTTEDVLADLEATTEVGGAPLRLAAVDYAQGFVEDDKGMERMCSTLCMGLREWSKRRRAASVLGSQVRSEVIARGRARWERSLQAAERDNKRRPDISGFRPGKGDAMWSQRLEQYSKAVWYPFRPGRWWKEMCAGDAARAAVMADDTIELRVGKQNFGPEGWETFRWDGATTRIGAVVR